MTSKLNGLLRVLYFQCNPDLIPVRAETPPPANTGSDDSSLSGRSPQERRALLFYAPQGTSPVPKVGAWFLHHENTQSVQSGNRSPDLWICVPVF